MKFSPLRIFLCLLLVGVFVFALLFLAALGAFWIIEAVWTLASGWATYPFQILPQVSYNFEMIACGLTALALAMSLSHRLLRWLAAQAHALPTPWSFKYTAYLSFLLLSMFGTSIAMTGIIHQTAWLASSDTLTRTSKIRETSFQKSSAYDLLLILSLIGSETGDSEDRYPPSLSEALAIRSDEYGDLDILCDYQDLGPVPWLYPGGDQLISSGITIPILVSPYPNSDSQIVVAYSDFTTENHPADELPPEIAVFFE